MHLSNSLSIHKEWCHKGDIFNYPHGEQIYSLWSVQNEPASGSQEKDVACKNNQAITKSPPQNSRGIQGWKITCVLFQYLLINERFAAELLVNRSNNNEIPSVTKTATLPFTKVLTNSDSSLL